MYIWCSFRYYVGRFESELAPYRPRPLSSHWFSQCMYPMKIAMEHQSGYRNNDSKRALDHNK